MDGQEFLNLTDEILEAKGDVAIVLLGKYPDVLAEYWRIVKAGCVKAICQGRQCEPRDIFSGRKPRILHRGGLRVILGQELREAIFYRDDTMRWSWPRVFMLAGGIYLHREYSWRPVSYPDLGRLLHCGHTSLVPRASTHRPAVL